MESFGDSSCHSMSDSFSLYERYMRSFNVVDTFVESSHDVRLSPHREYESSCEGNIDLSDTRKHCETAELIPLVSDANVAGPADKVSNSLDADFCSKIEDHDLASPLGSLLGNSSTAHSILTEKSDATDLPVSSEDFKSNCFKHPVFITSTMENSNNAVDSVPLFRDVRPSDTVFKLPIRELSFNGTIKHVQKLKPIVDPITALTSEAALTHLVEKPMEHPLESFTNKIEEPEESGRKSSLSDKVTESSESSLDAQVDKCMESMGDSQYEDYNQRGQLANDEGSSNMEHSYSSMEASFDSGVRSPDMFADEDAEANNAQPLQSFWTFLKDYEAYDKRRVKKLEETLQGILPPPSVTTLRTDVTEMLKKYYSSLHLFTNDSQNDLPNMNPKTPSKRVSFVQMPILDEEHDIKPNFSSNKPNFEENQEEQDIQPNFGSNKPNVEENQEECDIKPNFGSNLPSNFEGNQELRLNLTSGPSKAESSLNLNSDVFNSNTDQQIGLNFSSNDPSDSKNQESDLKLSSEELSNFNKGERDVKDELSTSADNNFEMKLSTEIEMKETAWPEILKCRYYDVHYNLSPWTEKLELLSMKYGQRFVGVETEGSLSVYGGLRSPSSASKRKALRLKMAQVKSPGRRLSHLARRRQAFCSAATINEKAQSTARMVLIDKKKLINSGERKSPRTRRTPGKKTPGKTPKKTPRKTPKSGGSSKKKAMRRLLMDPDTLTRSQPQQNTIKRALFISPENRKAVPQGPSSSVPVQAMKSKRALFSSPVTADTKSMDGTRSDQFMKRKLSALDEIPESSRSKLCRSLSFGGDVVGARAGCSQYSISRRDSEFATNSRSKELTEIHKKKLLWAVSEALRTHGWRLSSPGFREKASALARLTRRLLALPVHAARLAAPNTSTSETMLKLARQYVFSIIQGRTVEELYLEEQTKLSSHSTKVSGYISAAAYQQMKTKASTSTSSTSQVKENLSGLVKVEPPRSNSKNILQDKLVNIDTNSNSNSSSSGLSMIDHKSALFKSNSMPSFEAAKMRARRQISFDNIEFPKR